MSSFEVIGSILELYSHVQHALSTSRGRGSSRYAESLEKDVATQEVIFREFLSILLPVESRSSSPQEMRPSSIRSISQGSVLEPSPPYAVSQNEEARGYSAFGAFTSYLRGTATREAVPWYDLALGSPASLERLFAPEKAQRVLETLEEIQEHLRVIEKEVNTSAVSRVSHFTKYPLCYGLIRTLSSATGSALHFHPPETLAVNQIWSARQIFQKN
jgi:hypothetical protein